MAGDQSATKASRNCQESRYFGTRPLCQLRLRLVGLAGRCQVAQGRGQSSGERHDQCTDFLAMRGLVWFVRRALGGGAKTEFTIRQRGWVVAFLDSTGSTNIHCQTTRTPRPHPHLFHSTSPTSQDLIRLLDLLLVSAKMGVELPADGIERFARQRRLLTDLLDNASAWLWSSSSQLGVPRASPRMRSQCRQSGLIPRFFFHGRIFCAHEGDGPGLRIAKPRSPKDMSQPKQIDPGSELDEEV